MPFDDQVATQAAASGPHMQVDPDKLAKLIQRIEDRRDILQEYIERKRLSAFTLRPLGSDPRSAKNSEAVNENGRQALEAVRAYADELDKVAGELTEIARQYGVLEEQNTDKFRQVPE